MAVKPSPNPKNNMWDLIAYYLRFYRKAVRANAPETARIMNVSEATLSRTEQGTRRLAGSEAAALDKAWSTGGIFVLLVFYASIGHDPQWFAEYLTLEQHASILRIFEALVIPGIVQTEDYARSLLEVGSVSDPDKVLRDRLARQGLFAFNHPPFVELVISQAALEWPVGSPEIMRAQLDKLLEVSELPHVVLRVVPRSWDTGAYAGLDGSFFLLSGEFGEVAFAESPEAGRLVSTPQEVRSFAVRFGRVGAKALQDRPSRQLIQKIKEGF